MSMCARVSVRSISQQRDEVIKDCRRLRKWVYVVMRKKITCGRCVHMRLRAARAGWGFTGTQGAVAHYLCPSKAELILIAISINDTASGVVSLLQILILENVGAARRCYNREWFYKVHVPLQMNST